MVENFHETPCTRHRRTLTGAWGWVYTINVKEALSAARGRVRIQLGGSASGMRQKDTGTPKKKTRRAAGQMVASAVMALAIAVGGFGTTALLASQPAGLTVEPSALLWEGESNAAHSTKKDDKKEAPKPSKTDSASSEAESAAASAAQPAAPSQNETEAPAVSEAPAAPAEETAASPAAPEAAPADPMMGSIEELEQENNFPSLQQETEALAAEDPLSAPVEQAAEVQPEAGAETNSEEAALPVKTEEGTILLTPEEIRAALDAGTLDESSIDPACLTDENGLLSWLWNLLFGRSDKDDSGSSTPAPVYSGWRTVGGKTYYYDQYTNQPVKGIQSIDNKLYYFDANGLEISVQHRLGTGKDGGRQVRHHPHRLPRLRQRCAGAGPHVRAALHQRPQRGPEGGRLLLQSGRQRGGGPGGSHGLRLRPERPQAGLPHLLRH